MPLVSSTILPIPAVIIPAMISFSNDVVELAMRLNQPFLLRVSPRTDSNRRNLRAGLTHHVAGTGIALRQVWG